MGYVWVHSTSCFVNIIFRYSNAYIKLDVWIQIKLLYEFYNGTPVSLHHFKWIAIKYHWILLTFKDACIYNILFPNVHCVICNIYLFSKKIIVIINIFRNNTCQWLTKYILHLFVCYASHIGGQHDCKQIKWYHISFVSKLSA